MKKSTLVFLFLISALFYFFLIPEIVFNHLTDNQYSLFIRLTNPFRIFGSDANTLVVSLIILPLLFAYLTVISLKKILRKN